MSPFLALVPLRKGKRLGTNEPSVEDHNLISLQKPQQIGRPELFSCLYAACDCDKNKNIGSTQNKCQDCEKITQALKPFVSRCTFKVLTANTLLCRGGRNTAVLVNSKEVSANEMWSEEIAVKEGMQISITTNFETLKVGETVDDVDNRSVCLEFQVVSVDATNDNAPCIKESDQSCNSPNRESPLRSSLSGRIDCLPMFGTQETPDAICRGYIREASLESLSPLHDCDSSFPVPSTFSSLPAFKSPTAGNDSLNAATCPASKASSCSPNRNLKPLNTSLDVSTNDVALPVLESCSEQKHSKSASEMTRTNTSLVTLTSKKAGMIQEEQKSNTIPPKPSTGSDASEDQFRPVLYFCPLGQDLPKARIRALSANAKKLGATVVEDFSDATHMIVSEFITSWEKIANRLGMKEEEELKSYLISNNIKVIKPKWIASITAAKEIRKPFRGEHWSFVIATGSDKKRKSGGTPSSQKKVRKLYGANEEISKVFKKLAKLYQSCPIEKDDVWRAYQFRINAGRVIQLGFEISDDTLDKLKKDVVGFGDSCLEIISQYFESGGVERIKILETEKSRVAMHKMMDIWGVGRKKALELIHDNCCTIEDVRRRLAGKTLSLERNQLVGVECYEDILEEMPRDEAARIGQIIEKHTLSIYGEAEVRIMGSYRRGKQTCGDVDVHITCKKFEKKIPADALGNIVDSLWRNGHLCFHLTFLDGMETGSELDDYQRAGRMLPTDVWETSKALGPPRRRRMEKASSSYMGVFNSPVKKAVRRRVDIKFYPYCERIFAALYFTGNGYFNRSMRLWAGNKGFQLNDHGLFERGTKDRVMEATEERQVFERLELVYKEPQERDSFDALEPKSGAMTDFEPSMSELKDYNDNAWVG